MTKQLDQVSLAVMAAAAAHAGQKYGDQPYIVHPLRVALLLVDEGASEAEVCAGLLHDVVEDRGATIDSVRRQFGAEVAQLVSDVTHQKGVRYEDYIARIPHRAVRLKLADVRCNLAAVRPDDPEADRRRRKYAAAHAALTARASTGTGQ